jgi:ABC-type dipeptide/oligopeptide/nickel transport system permease subunit
MDSEMKEASVATLPKPDYAEEEKDGPSRLRGTIRLFQRSKLALVGAILVFVLVAVAVTAPLIAPHGPNVQDLFKALQPPAWHENGSIEFPLGTDQFGRDIFSRIVFGARVTLVAAFFAALFAALFGTLLGLLAGFRGGRLDTLVMRLVDVQLGFPLVLLALTIVAILGASLRNLIIAMAITGWMVYTRVVRAAVLSLREQEFVEAARASGATDARIVFIHILPNVFSQVLIILTLEIARMALMEASLSYLGLGVPPPAPSWGRMLSESREYMVIAYWIVLFPGTAIMLTVLGVNFLGDGLRDALDPTLRREI